MMDSKTKQAGGARPGAGRKKGSGVYGETTQVMRIPQSRIEDVKAFLRQTSQASAGQNVPQNEQNITRPGGPRTILQGKNAWQVYVPQGSAEQSLPLFNHRVAAGFPSPADDFVEQHLDLNSHLIPHPEATFLVRVQGDSMIKAGIHDGDMLVVDRSLTPQHGKIVIAALNGELTVKRLHLSPKGNFLMAENDAYAPIPLHEDLDVVIWGVVTTNIASLL